MDAFSAEMNQLLVDVYRSIHKVEASMLRSLNGIDLSISELHVVEAVGRDRQQGRTISELAQELEITLPSMTMAVKKLVLKGYCEKVKSERDGRMVYVKLTRQGARVDAAHRYFHEQMIRSMVRTFSEEDRQALLGGLRNLDAFFRERLAEIEKKTKSAEREMFTP